MREGIDYREYMANIKKKNDAWNVVCGCFTFAYETFPADVFEYFEAIEEIYEAGYTETGELLSEEECVKGIKGSIDWLERQVERAVECFKEDGWRCKIDKRVIKNLKRVLKHKFGVEVEK